MRAVASATVLGVIVAGLGSPLLQADATSTSQTHTQVLESYGRLPLHFERNDGQVDTSVRFLARGSGYSLFLRPTEAVLALRQRATANEAVLQFTLAGGNRRPIVAGRGELAGRINYVVGNDPAGWRTNIPTYARVHYSDVYPGIDLVYYGNQQQLEYDFVVAPGADPRRIRMVFDGARAVRIDADGELILSVAGGELRQRKPVVYQEVAGMRWPVTGRYVMKGERGVGFAVGAYDESRPLVIDPVLTYSTFLGGATSDEGHDIAVDAAGNAYITGETNSVDFPTMGAPFSAHGGDFDAFVTKLNASGTALVYSTYLGGSAIDEGHGIAVDGAGSAYITGLTNSDNFPTASPYDAVRNGQDAFVAKLNPTGSALIYSTFFGGSASEIGFDIAVDSTGSAYVTGQTASTQASADPPLRFPLMAALQPTYGGATDAFLTKFNPAGTGLVYSTYLGGSAEDIGHGVAVDTTGNTYVTGETRSANFPTAPAGSTALGGAIDAFVAKVNPAGGAFVFSRYLGGTVGPGAQGGRDRGFGIAADLAGNAYVVGHTVSTDFPATTIDTSLAGTGTTDAFVTKFTAGGALTFSTYLGGEAADNGNDIALDSAGDIYVTGGTASADFPTTPDALDGTFTGSSDAFVTRLDTVGSTLLYSSYLGGQTSDAGQGIAVDNAGSAYVTGSTSSNDFPIFPNPGAFQDTRAGGLEAFVTKIGGGVPASLTLDPPSDTNIVGTTHCVTATVADEWGNPVPDTMVRFTVMGAVSTSGSGTTDAGGQTEFCYDGPTVTGLDAISAFADTNADGAQDAGEPSGQAAKTWVAGSPARLTVTPPAETNPVGTQHCVIATVSDTFGNPTPGIAVRFSVTGAVNTSGSAPTDTNGQAGFCYDGPTVTGLDAISAFSDTNADGTQDAGEPGGEAAKTWVAGSPATLTVTPPAATNPVGTEHCVVAAVSDAFGNPTPDITVRFTVTGAVNTTGFGTTDAAGRAGFCYTGPSLPGSDVITAYADTDADDVRDPGEPAGTATNTWTASAGTGTCTVAGGGYIMTSSGSRATFGGVARSADGVARGIQAYVDHGRDKTTKMTVISQTVDAVDCHGVAATIFGRAWVHGYGTVMYRIDVTDGTYDTYSIQLSNGYASGTQVVLGGNIKIF